MTSRQPVVSRPAPLEVGLRAWTPDDLGLMERLLGDPRMTQHLGGPESPKKIRGRLDRYLSMADGDGGRMFVITAGPEALDVGSVGYWVHEAHGQPAWETGWSVLEAYQGQGIATRATALAIDLARAEGRGRAIHAYPSVDNEPSNAVCRKLGFSHLGVFDFEYPPGNPIRCNDWAADLPLPAGIGMPATNAFALLGLTRLEHFAGADRAELARIHGVGPRALDRLAAALADHGLSFGDSSTAAT